MRHYRSTTSLRQKGCGKITTTELVADIHFFSYPALAQGADVGQTGRIQRSRPCAARGGFLGLQNSANTEDEAAA
jgi:hypothetical protein